MKIGEEARIYNAVQEPVAIIYCDSESCYIKYLNSDKTRWEFRNSALEMLGDVLLQAGNNNAEYQRYLANPDVEDPRR